MCCDAQLFSSIEKCDEKKIKLGDTREVSCNQKGTVDVLLKLHARASPF